VNFWQALFSRRKNLSPKKRRKKPQGMGWQGWALLGGALAVGAVLAVLMSALARKTRLDRQGPLGSDQTPQHEQPADPTPQDD